MTERDANLPDLKTAVQPRRRRKLLLLAVVAFLGFLAVDYLQYHRHSDQARDVVRRLGGKFGSLSIGVDWPLGREWQISFQRPLEPAELDELRIVNGLRGYVGVAFVDCGMTASQLAEARQKLSDCLVFEASVKPDAE